MSSWSSNWKAIASSSGSSSSAAATSAPPPAAPVQQSIPSTSSYSDSRKSNSGGFASNWQAVAKISTSEIVKQLQVFSAILQSTRQPSAFMRWNKATIEKAFKWADTIKALCSAADDVQLRSIRDNHMQPLHISLIDSNPLLLLKEPVETLLKCTVSSPALPHLGSATAAQLLLSELLLQAGTRLGRDKAVQIACDCVSDALVFRVTLFRTISSNDNNDYNEENLVEDPSPDLSLLAFELLLTCYKLSSSSGAKVAEVEAKIAAAVASDEPTLHLLCRALVLSPLQCAAALDIRNPLGGTTGEPEGSWGRSLPEDLQLLERLRAFQSSFEASYLWRVIEGAVAADVARMLSIDSESRVLRQLLERRPELRQAFVEALLAATAEGGEGGDLHGDVREKKEGMLEEVLLWNSKTITDERARAALRLNLEVLRANHLL